MFNLMSKTTNPAASFFYAEKIGRALWVRIYTYTFRIDLKKIKIERM